VSPAAAQKLLPWAALAALALLAGLLATAPLLVDRGALARRIETEIQAASGLRVQIGAVRGLRLLPTPRLVLGPLRLLPAPGAQPADGTDPHTQPGADVLRLDFSLPALLRARAEPVSLHLTGLDLDWQPRPAGTPELGGLRLPRIGVQGASLTLDYAAGAERLHWRLFAPPLAWRPAADSGPLRVTGVLPIAGPASDVTGTLQVDAEVATTELPTLDAAPLWLAGRLTRVGPLQDLKINLSAEHVTRNPAGAWRLDGLLLDAGGLRLTGAAELSVGAAGELLGQGNVALAPVDLRAWLETHAEAPMPGSPGTWRCIAASTDLRFDAGLLGIAPIRLAVDATRASAAATVLLSAPPRASVAVQLADADLDPYLAPPTAAPKPPSPTECATEDATDAFPQTPAPPVPPPADVDLGVALWADALRAGGLGYGAVTGTLKQRGAHTIAELVSAGFYSGDLNARGERMLYPGVPAQYTLRAEIKGAELGPVLTDLTGEAQVTGKITAAAELTAAGAALPEMRRDLSGTVRLEVRDGSLAALERAAAEFGPLLATVGLEVDAETGAFARLGLSATGRYGVFGSDDIYGRGRLAHLTGSGELDLVEETLAAALTATLVQRPDGPDLKGLDGIQVPIQVSGTMAAPKVQAKVGPALAEAAKRRARQHLERDDNVLRQLEEATGVEGLEEGLRGLFGF
jgi:hypothetical protein